MPARAVPRRRRARQSTALAIIAALGATGTACDGGDSDGPTPSAVAIPTAPTLTCGKAAPDGGTIELVEAGFSTVNEPDEDPEVSYGAVLENTSVSYLAILTPLTIQLTDADGDQAIDRSFDQPSPPLQATRTIFPGQQMGLGDLVFLDRGGIEEITVVVEGSVWVPIDQVRDVGPASATDIDFERSGRTGARIGFSVTPSVDPAQNRDSGESISEAKSWAIFRDDSSNIVGGASGPPGTSWGDAGRRGPDDPITAFVSASRVPDDAVDGSTEVYVSPFYPPYRTHPC